LKSDNKNSNKKKLN